MMNDCVRKRLIARPLAIALIHVVPERVRGAGSALMEHINIAVVGSSRGRIVQGGVGNRIIATPVSAVVDVVPKLVTSALRTSVKAVKIAVLTHDSRRPRRSGIRHDLRIRPGTPVEVYVHHVVAAATIFVEYVDASWYTHARAPFAQLELRNESLIRISSGYKLDL